jgi:hypothetical protein
VPANTALSGLPVFFNPDQTVTSRIPILSRNAIGRSIKNSDQLNAIIAEWNGLPACPAPAPCNAGGAILTVPGGVDFFSPFSSLDFRLTKEIRLTERMRLSLIGEAFNIFNFTNVRGTSKNSYSGRNVAISPDTPADHIQTDFYNPVSVAGGFFGAGGPRAFQFAARFSF